MRLTLKMVDDEPMETIDGTCGQPECLTVLEEHAGDATAVSIINELTSLFDTPMHDRKLDVYKSALRSANRAAPKYFKELREKKFSARYASTLDTAVVAATKTNEMAAAASAAMKEREEKLLVEMAKMTPKVRSFFLFLFSFVLKLNIIY
jgi:hypothetical protein